MDSTILAKAKSQVFSQQFSIFCQ